MRAIGRGRRQSLEELFDRFCGLKRSIGIAQGVVRTQADAVTEHQVPVVEWARQLGFERGHRRRVGHAFREGRSKIARQRPHAHLRRPVAARRFKRFLEQKARVSEPAEKQVLPADGGVCVLPAKAVAQPVKERHRLAEVLFRLVPIASTVDVNPAKQPGIGHHRQVFRVDHAFGGVHCASAVYAGQRVQPRQPRHDGHRGISQRQLRWGAGALSEVQICKGGVQQRWHLLLEIEDLGLPLVHQRDLACAPAR